MTRGSMVLSMWIRPAEQSAAMQERKSGWDSSALRVTLGSRADNSFEPRRLDIPSLETGDLHSMQPTPTQEPWVWSWSVVWRVMHPLHISSP